MKLNNSKILFSLVLLLQMLSYFECDAGIIKLKTIADKIITTEYELTDTFAQVKEKIESNKSIDRYAQCIIIGNKEVEDDEIVMNYKHSSIYDVVIGYLIIKNYIPVYCHDLSTGFNLQYDFGTTIGNIKEKIYNEISKLVQPKNLHSFQKFWKIYKLRAQASAQDNDILLNDDNILASNVITKDIQFLQIDVPEEQSIEVNVITDENSLEYRISNLHQALVQLKKKLILLQNGLMAIKENLTTPLDKLFEGKTRISKAVKTAYEKLYTSNNNKKLSFQKLFDKHIIALARELKLALEALSQSDGYFCESQLTGSFSFKKSSPIKSGSTFRKKAELIKEVVSCFLYFLIEANFGIKSYFDAHAKLDNPGLHTWKLDRTYIMQAARNAFIQKFKDKKELIVLLAETLKKHIDTHDKQNLFQALGKIDFSLGYMDDPDKKAPALLNEFWKITIFDKILNFDESILNENCTSMHLWNFLLTTFTSSEQEQILEKLNHLLPKQEIIDIISRDIENYINNIKIESNQYASQSDASLTSFITKLTTVAQEDNVISNNENVNILDWFDAFLKNYKSYSDKKDLVKITKKVALQILAQDSTMNNEINAVNKEPEKNRFVKQLTFFITKNIITQDELLREKNHFNKAVIDQVVEHYSVQE